MRNVSVTWKMNQLLSMALALAFILSVILPGSLEVNAAAATEVMASSYSDKFLITTGDTVLVLDKDVTLSVVVVNDGSLTIKNKAGENHTLTTGSIGILHKNADSSVCKLNIESGTIKVNEGGIMAEGGINIASGVNLDINTTEVWDPATYNYYVGLYSDGSITSGGNVNIEIKDSYAIDCKKDLTINGGSLKVNSGGTCIQVNNLYINDGNLDLRGEKKFNILARDLYISGGKIFAYSGSAPGIMLRHLTITGGYIEVETGNNYGRPWFSLDDGNYPSISDNMKITFYDDDDEGDNNGTEFEAPYRLMDSDEMGKLYPLYSGRISYVIDRGVSDFDSDDYSARAPRRVIIQDTAPKKDNSSASTGNGSTGTASTGSSAGTSNGTSTGNTAATKYSSEWVNGKWYNADGTQTYQGTLEWKCNSTGWWVEDTTGWYPVSQWQKIDGKWYYFLDSGYMDYSEYRDGYWLGSDGALVDGYYGEWKSDSKGWWFEDTSGWYPQSQYLWIDGTSYYFGADGYWTGA